MPIIMVLFLLAGMARAQNRATVRNSRQEVGAAG